MKDFNKLLTSFCFVLLGATFTSVFLTQSDNYKMYLFFILLIITIKIAIKEHND